LASDWDEVGLAKRCTDAIRQNVEYGVSYYDVGWRSLHQRPVVGIRLG